MRLVEGDDTDLAGGIAPDGRYTHSDFLSSATEEEITAIRRIAIQNIARASGGVNHDAVQFGLALAHSVVEERESRMQYQDIVREAFSSMGIDYPRLQTADAIALESFANFITCYRHFLSEHAMNPTTRNIWLINQYLSVGKGLASELGQKEQNASWSGVEMLDADTAQLDDLGVLEELGLWPIKIYQHDGEGKISYDFSSATGFSNSRYIQIERKRPGADYGIDISGPTAESRHLAATNGRVIEKVKSAIFVADLKQLSSDQRTDAMEILNEGNIPTNKSRRKKLGETTVEPQVLDQTLRGTNLFPASALYYVLARRPRSQRR